MSGKTRLASISFGIASALFAVSFPAVADTKLDPDPAALSKARTLATAKADENFDVGSPKAPFPIRFAVCALRLTAIRDEGRALPVAPTELNAAITASRTLAIELKAYSAKVSAADAEKSVDADLAKSLPETIGYERADVNDLGVAVIKKRNAERLLGCQLMRDWYAAQNGLATPVAAAEQAKVAVLNEEQRAKEKKAAEKLMPAPYPAAISPSMVKPQIAATPPAIPDAPTFIPPPGTPAGGDDPRDARIGADIADARARAEFSGRPMWSAMAECIVRMDVIQAKGGGSTKLQTDGYAEISAMTIKVNRGTDKPTASALVARERERLRPRVAAKWDADYARIRALPWGEWGQACHGLQQHVNAYVTRQNNIAYQKYLADFQRQRQLENERDLAKSAAQSPSSSASSSGGYYSAPSSSGDNGAAARQAHEATMERYKYENQQIRNDIKAIDRKYGR